MVAVCYTALERGTVAGYGPANDNIQGLTRPPDVDSNEYQKEIRGMTTAWALRGEATAVLGALFDGIGCSTGVGGGRGTIRYFPLSRGEGVLRRYQRGGVAACVLKDGFFGNRMEREFDVMCSYRRDGGPVPEPLGVCWSRRGGFFRGAIATRRIPGQTLLEYLQGVRPAQADAVLRKTGVAIRHMHDQGVWHADLQVKNILVADNEIWLIDFDNARRAGTLGAVACARNLLRLRRSFEKHGLALDNFATLLAGYGALAIPKWLDWAYRVRSARDRLKTR